MEIADSFVPTAGVVGVFPLVTYFLLIVATYSFLGTFIFALVSRTSPQGHASLPLLLTAVIAAISGFSYYRIQGYYHDMLAELATVVNPSDRLVLIRESYNAIGQFRYMDWSITIPLLLIQVALMAKLQPAVRTQTVIRLVAGSFFMALTGYIGHQQLAFDNEILIGPKLIWGAISLLGYGVVVYTLLPIWKQLVSEARPNLVYTYRLITYALGFFSVVYPLGYLLTCIDIDFNWIHIAYTIADVSTKIGIGLVIYFANTSLSQPNE